MKLLIITCFTLLSIKLTAQNSYKELKEMYHEKDTLYVL